MANIAIFRINYKSDFILTLNSDAGWMTPFCIKFWTGAPSQAYFAGYDGTTYTHCAPVDGEPTKLLVQFDDHHLPIGDLKFQIGYHFTVADFHTNVEDEVINQASVIIEVDNAPAQVMLDLNGETAPEIEFSLPAYANEAQRIANEEARIAAEQQRIANEESRIAAETIRQQNEQQRIDQETARVNEFATLKSQSQAATRDANDAATLANQKAQLAADKAALANDAATLANQKAQLAADKAALANDAAQLAADKAALAQQKAEYAQQQGSYAKDQGDYAKNQGNYAKEQGEIAQADHQRAETDHGIAVDDHTQAGNDHTRAEADHGIAVDDHTQAGNDHTRAESDHGIAADDHTQAGNDHTRAESDHGIAADDHTQAGNDHTRAESDHTRAESDHAAVEVYVDSLGAFDISAYHATGGEMAKYADLATALGTNGANIPDALRRGGMSVKFVLTSDNKYMQFRYLLEYADTTEGNAAFVNPDNWQGVDLEITKDSHNLAESGAVATAVENAKDDIRNGEDVVSYQKIENYKQSPVAQTYFNFGTSTPTTWPYNSNPSTSPQITQYTTAVINVSAGTRFYIKGAAGEDRQRMYLIVDANNNVLADARMSPAYTRDEQSPVYQFEVDCRVFMNTLSPWNNETDGVYGKVVTHIDGTNEQIEELRNDLNAVSDDVADLDIDINGQEYDEYIHQQSENVASNTYFNFNSVSVGGAWPYNASPSQSSAITGYTTCTKTIPANTPFRIRGYNNGTNSRVNMFVIASPQSICLVKSRTSQITREEYFDYQFDTEVRVYFNLNDFNAEIDGVYYLEHIINKGIKEKVEELQDKVIILDNNPFKGKKIVTIGDSLCTSGKWQKRLCEIIGADDFDNSVNIDPSYPLTVGGTSMYGTKKDMGLCRVRNLAHLDFTPDIILLENVNDKSAFYTDGSPLSSRAGQITDKPYIIQQIIEDVATSQEWASDAESVLASIPSVDRKFGTMLMITSTGPGKNVKPTTSPSTAGTVTLTLSGGGLSQTYSIYVEANESLSSIVTKILEYDYAGYSDTLASDGDSVDFFQESGLTNLQISYNANGTGLVLTITDTSTAKSQNGVFFDGDSLSDWEDSTKWLNIIPLYRAWKGVIEYCNINYPNAKVYIVAFSGIAGDSSDYLLSDGTYDQDAFLATQKRQRALVIALKNVAELYSVPFINVAHNEGINIVNINTYLPEGSVHPYDAGYNRWGEVIASLMK